jgi:hypothetical protein
VGEIDEPQHAEDDREPERDRDVDEPANESVEQLSRKLG